MRLASALLIAALLSPTSAAALCELPITRPVVMTPDVTTAEGGVVVGTQFDGGSGKEEGDATQRAWTIKTKTGSVKPTLVELAPGLVVYQLPAKIDGGELFDGTKAIAKLARAKGPSLPLAAPAPTKITYKEWPSRRGNSVQVAAVFGAIPADAIALVVVDAATKKPRSYGLVTAGALEIPVYYQGRCSALPNGTSLTSAGDKVILRWVDKTGVLSADSKPIAVKKI